MLLFRPTIKFLCALDNEHNEDEHYGRLTFGQMERIMVIEKNTKLKEPEAA